MKRIIPIAALSLAMSTALADEASKPTPAIGVGSGALIGAVFGGPLGGILGAAIGGHYADSVVRSAQANRLEVRLDDAQSVIQDRDGRLARLNRDLFETRSELERLGEEMGELLLERAVFEGLQMEVMYPTGTAELSAGVGERLQRLAGLLDRVPEMTVRLDGYADPRGDEHYNMGLSEARAAAVRDALIAAGIEAGRISLYAHGETGSAAGEGDLDAYALDRRVRIRLFSPGTAGRVAQQD